MFNSQHPYIHMSSQSSPPWLQFQGIRYLFWQAHLRSRHTCTPNTSAHKTNVFKREKKKEVFCSSSVVASRCCPQVTMLNSLQRTFLSQAFWQCEISLSYDRGVNRAICLPEAWSRVGSPLFCWIKVLETMRVPRLLVPFQLWPLDCSNDAGHLIPISSCWLTRILW